jgi:tetratricopeptide (TPR) repeat protein
MDAHAIKEDLSKRGDAYFEQAFVLYKSGAYTQSLSSLNRAFGLNSFNLQYYLLKFEILNKMNDYEGAKAVLEKLLGVISAWTSKSESKYDEIKTIAIDKIADCYYMQAEQFWNLKRYESAYEAFCNVCQLRPSLGHSMRAFEIFLSIF